MSVELITRYYQNGRIKSQGHYESLVPVGNHTSWYVNGNKQYESIELDESTDIVTYWHENGQIKSKGVQTESWETGLWTEWYENGNKKSEGLYKGKYGRSGKWRFWHINGQLACTGIQNGWAGDGLWVFWDEIGNKVHERKYKEFQLIDVWKHLRESECSDKLIKKFKWILFS